ncbi:P-loop NTPase fold protein [Chryseobacterium sp. SSA4.19]|uniref:P-loop NTPase fold protein n=1 Tax=Chryseobacterium sp. SSA4.19 TaxID=2919915 RepID=UPI001F4EAE43|nr:P-loop NTPase fold protein [Chryseobacterium sp. SSA4.19]MCJ8154277.1 P-loop NTPase fold protein [Chryseobacterium sp. SSA4.19]
MGRELIEKVFQKFENHLNIENNNRIVFSGKFGIGKSYFLNEFFNDEKYNDEYFPIFINPVNYSIASNEDIFELIKFDILFQILSQDVIIFENLNFSKGNLIHQYFSNKFLEDFVSASDLIGESVVEDNASGSYGILKNLGKLIAKLTQLSARDFKNFENEIQKNPELEVINNFFKKHEGKIGSFYENNAITQLLFELIKNIEQETKKKMTLVIDDLDRIDPEHIFRILNIFSAHDKLGENKFGFEKVILVCDINNIKHIYHHFYGENVDFFGYINKFYSSEVYHYKNTDYLLAFADDFELSRSNFRDENKKEFFKFIFSDAIENNFITARQLFSNDFSFQNILNKCDDFSNVDLNRTYYNGRKINNFSSFRNPYSLAKTLLYFFGDEKIILNFINIIEKQQLIYLKEILISFLMFSELKVVSEANTIFSVKGINMKSNNYGDYEITDNFKIETLDLVEVFKDIFKITKDIIIK